MDRPLDDVHQPPAPPPDQMGDETELFARYGSELAAAVEAALGPWVFSAVAARLQPDQTAPSRHTPSQGTELEGTGVEGTEVEGDLDQWVAEAANAAVDEVGARLRDLLALDLDQQWTNPLTLIRQAVAYPTAVLARAGVPPVQRDATDARIHPDDVYALTPAAFADLGPEVHERGLRWGAAKAHLHIQRRRHMEQRR